MARNKNKGKGKNKGGGGGGGNKNKGGSGGNKNKGGSGGNNNTGSSSNKGSGGGGGKPSQSSSSSSRRQQAKAAANMSVKQRRTAAKEAGVGLKDFKAGRTGANAVARRDAQREANRPGSGTTGPQTPTPGTFTTAAGYQMEKGAYNTRSKEIMDKYKTENPGSSMSNLPADNASFDEDGYLSYDSTKVQWQGNDMLKEAGYKAGDMLWKPGSLDNLNGRKLTGRIARVTELGNFVPEYEHDAVNSSHRSTGNPGYAGEVGLGADQYAYNRQYEQNNDVATGQTNHQLQNNGYDEQAIDNYWTDTNNRREQAEAARGGSVRPEDVKPITANQDPASSGGSVDNGANSVNSSQNFTNNFFKGLNPSYKTSYKAPSIDDISGMYEKMGFNFDPNRFNTQGQ